MGLQVSAMRFAGQTRKSGKTDAPEGSEKPEGSGETPEDIAPPAAEAAEQPQPVLDDAADIPELAAEPTEDTVDLSSGTGGADEISELAEEPPAEEIGPKKKGFKLFPELKAEHKNLISKAIAKLRELLAGMLELDPQAGWLDIAGKLVQTLLEGSKPKPAGGSS